MPADALEVLDEHRRRQAGERDVLGDAWARPELMFASEHGDVMTPVALQHHV